MDKTLALVALAALAALGLLAPAYAQDDDVAQAVKKVAAEASQRVSAAMPGTRVAVEVGRLDPRLKLAPCAQVQPYLPPNVKLWGAARIGLRCLSGPVRWNVYLPLKVSVHARGLVAAAPLPAGATLASADLREAEIDLADGPASAIMDATDAVGRTVARPIAAGAALRSGDLKPRQWFAAGETVKIVAAGAGYAVSGEGQAMSPGVDGQPVRVRTGSGRIVTGTAVAERQVALPP